MGPPNLLPGLFSVHVEQEIRRRIEERGRITFAEFMELALYWPVGGYYSRRDNVGAGGDYYTSPSAHPAFGALLCLQVFQMWRLLDCPSPFWLVEMGAGDGLLCHDLISYSVHLPPEFRDSLRYLCLDRHPSPGVEGQSAAGSRSLVARLASRGVPLRGITGCCLSNELLDSFPVHRVVVQDATLKEIYVAVQDGQLTEVLDSPSTPALQARLESLELSLPDGFSAEINLALVPWMEELSAALDRGFLLTVDYGHPARELYSRQRRRGTFTCFYRHTQTDDPYRHIGEQDMTSQVDFTSLINAGISNGLDPVGFSIQREFLRNLGLFQFLDRLRNQGLKQREVEANRMAMLDIVRPAGMGDFKVLVQGKGVGAGSLWGYEPSPELEDALRGLPVPLLTPNHISLLEGRYPHLAAEWEDQRVGQ